MKTIEQIFKENGEQFPFKVRSKTCSEGVNFHVVARSPDSEWIGWNHQGYSERHYGNSLVWELYTEPKVEEKKYEWLVFATNGSVHISVNMFTEKEAKENWPNAIKLVPQRELDEVTGKLVEVKS
jgi:hypothetical protein